MKLKGKIKFTNPEKNQFYNVLRKRVDQYFIDKKISKHANGAMIIKTVVLMLAYLLPLVYMAINAAPQGVVYGLYTFIGLALAGIGMSIMHDANHGAYSSSDTVNKWVGLSLNLCGGNVTNWKLQHNILHHTYTNIVHMDDDIADRLVLKMNPHTAVKWYHAFQPIYAFFFYGLLTLYWVVAKDFVQFNQFINNKVNTNTRSQNARMFIGIILAKLLHIGLFVLIPIFILGYAAPTVLLGFIVMHFVAGFILTLVFQLAHTVDETSHPLPNDEGNIENDWAIHQMNTTVNFSPDNAILSWYVGGLNYQVEHHLFPRICHVHYPAIAKIVQQTALEFNVPYLQHNSFTGAVASHVRALQKFGKLPSLNEAIG